MKLNEGLSEEQFKDIILNMLKDNSEYEKDQYKFLPIDDLGRDGTMEKKYLRLQDYIRNQTRISPKMYFDVNEKLKEIIREVVSKKKACWRGYKQIGMKEKNGKQVPNCVPIKKKK
jgi:hypothetical protein